MKRYEQLVELLATDIRNGRLGPGTRLPSIRTITAQHGLSASTAFKAYYRLEEKGLVRARPRSGYYVTAAGIQPLATPAQGDARGGAGSAHARVAPKLDVSELVFSVLGACRIPASCRWARRFRPAACCRCSAWASRWAASRASFTARMPWPACRRAIRCCASRSHCATWAWAWRSSPKS